MGNRDAEIGSCVRVARMGAGLSQKALVDRINTRGLNWMQTTASKVEAGTRPLLLSEAAEIATALGMTVDRLIGREEVGSGSRALVELANFQELIQRRVCELAAELDHVGRQQDG